MQSWQALAQPQLMDQAAAKNLGIIKDRAAVSQTLPDIDEFYSRFTTL